MENTPENKAKFFAQYWGQEVLRLAKTNHISVVTGIWLTGDFSKDYLELKPLSQITDEDAIETIMRSLNEEKERFKGSVSGAVRHYAIVNSDAFLATETDFLRSKGYALSWNGTSVEEQIEWGWIKLNTDH